ncbi:MAG TPA: class I SAM-dependent methyltransferase [Candidatus Dormibacteraeota bacterium]|jgi:SAM-dependent methyltransferase|nr:class I SAM-dependent methyltransferase [Candidatus Dormibacteraeota bacterium]
MTDRRTARLLAASAVAEGRPLDWFEQLYASARAGEAEVPWANQQVNPNLQSWLLLNPAVMHRTLVVGCGYGDDAQWLAAQGCEVTAFDIAPSAIERCSERFPGTSVHYQVANLLDPPRKWLASPFDLVVEAYTIQALPPSSTERRAAMSMLPNLTAGALLVIARARAEGEDPGSMPWPLHRGEFHPLFERGMQELLFEDYLDPADPTVRRFRGTFVKHA